MRPGASHPTGAERLDRVNPTARGSDRRARAARRLRRIVVGALVLGVVGGIALSAAIATDTFGAGQRFSNLVARIELVLDPPPDREIPPIVTVTPRPTVVPTASPIAVPSASPSGSGSAAPPEPTVEPTPEPTPERRSVDVDIVANAKRMFRSQLTPDWCAPAGVQMTLAVLGLGDTSERFQRELVGRIKEWQSRRDSLNGGWGPAAMVAALRAYGAHGYEVRAYETRADALRDAARAISETDAPAILLAWRGAHTWVMTGYRADADPTVFADARIRGAYILDPWYPRVSSIWGPSDPPGTYQDAAEMRRNFLAWKRPEGRYPDRDGKWIVVIPTLPADQLG
jgi:hypothetical protein